MRNKLDNKLEKRIFVSYSKNNKAYKLYDLVTKKIVISGDICFEENSLFVGLEIETKNLPIFPFELEKDDHLALESVENDNQGENVPYSPVSSLSINSSPSPSKKIRNLQKVIDTTKEFELNDGFFCFLCRRRSNFF